MITVIIKSVGPIALGGRELPAWFANVVALMAPALLAALVVTSALADGEAPRRRAPTRRAWPPPG